MHIGRMRKFTCALCADEFNDKESLYRHEKAYSLLKNIDPLKSPDDLMHLELKEKDETCLVIAKKNFVSIALLHSQECWSRVEHSCHDLPEGEMHSKTDQKKDG